ncbi:hypothetical protein [Aliagarivorans taiwanensis]|uniref:hypothetical protein n=1 Tax=Aliagarivorans taiwanensis TaxID=561966 RepID=UPI0012F93AF5|nr:hypothetical protein [Aliagarivorans taiwanensis]
MVPPVIIAASLKRVCDKQVAEKSNQSQSASRKYLEILHGRRWSDIRKVGIVEAYGKAATYLPVSAGILSGALSRYMIVKL